HGPQRHISPWQPGVGPVQYVKPSDFFHLYLPYPFSPPAWDSRACKRSIWLFRDVVKEPFPITGTYYCYCTASPSTLYTSLSWFSVYILDLAKGFAGTSLAEPSNLISC